MITNKPILRLAIVITVCCIASLSRGQTPPRCQIEPTAELSLNLKVDGATRLLFHGNPRAPRPFFFPVIGPSGESVTRMGHPGAPDHDHHRSLWFAHYKVDGFDFWSENGGTKIQQQQWLAIEDDQEASRFAVVLLWYDPEGTPLLSQQLIVELRPDADRQTQLEVQSIFTPGIQGKPTTLQQTNFGIFAIRMNKWLSNVFGSGVLTDDEGVVGEPDLFGKRHRWVDYSGRNSTRDSDKQIWFEEGVTYFDHPKNVGYPNGWHVRSDGWMCASPTMFNDIVVSDDQPLVLRYLLDIHRGLYDESRAAKLAEAFNTSLPMKVQPSSQSHIRNEIIRQ